MNANDLKRMIIVGMREKMPKLETGVFNLDVVELPGNKVCVDIIYRGDEMFFYSPMVRVVYDQPTHQYALTIKDKENNISKKMCDEADLVDYIVAEFVAMKLDQEGV